MPFHYPSAHLPAGRDLFGEVVREAHARRIRVIGRFDLSKTQRPVFEAHREWFFRRANGDPVIYNGLYSACINGGYYREHALAILTEALQRYEVDGLFFNMFGNPSTDYSGVATGPCHCEACQTRYRARYGRPVPAAADTDYRAFMAESSREVAASIAGLIQRKRPDAAFLTYIHDHTDGIMSESNTSVTRPLPLWPYSASDNVSRSLGSEPGKLAINLAMSFIDYPWRYANVPQAETALRPTRTSPRRAAALVVSVRWKAGSRGGRGRPISWNAPPQDLYVGQRTPRVLRWPEETRRHIGIFRLLTEAHIPASCLMNLGWLEEGPVDMVSHGRAASEPKASCGREAGCWCSTTHRVRCDRAFVGRRSTQGTGGSTDPRPLPSLKDTSSYFIDARMEIAPPRSDPHLIRRRCSVRRKRSGATKSRRQCRVSSSWITGAAVPPTSRGTSVVSTTVTARRPIAVLWPT